MPGPLQIRPIQLPVAQQDPLGSRGDPRAQQRDHRAVEGCGTMPCGTVAHTPRQGEGAPLRAPVAHPRQAPPADDTALQDPHQSLAGSMRQSEG
ncbi:MAG TPA: hypothetical protein VLQ80_14640, partial [Candidatus Saccharimonadia bacterium]|nr:hypothetical protein [Candidatus Saccharimonadia bacterium]